VREGQVRSEELGMCIDTKRQKGTYSHFSGAELLICNCAPMSVAPCDQNDFSHSLQHE